MQVELSDEDVRLAIEEYLQSRFPNYNINCSETKWFATRSIGTSVEAIGMKVELEEKL